LHNVFRFDPQARHFAGAFLPIEPSLQLNAISVGNNAVWGLTRIIQCATIKALVSSR
jgi:hypothetical protein